MSGRGTAFARGALSVTGANVVQYTFSFAGLIVLAHLLSPSQFGQVALAATIADFLMLLASLSLPAALLREREETVAETFNAAMYLTIAVNVAVLVVVAVAAGTLALAGNARLAAVLMILCTGRAISIAGYCYLTEVERRLAYNQFAVTQIASTVLSFVIAIGLAVAGAGIWALVAREVSQGLISWALSIAFSRWRFRRTFNRAKVSELFRFGVKMIGSRVGDMVFHRYDNLVVGAIAGTRALGLYNQAYTLAETSNRVFNPVISYLPLNFYAQSQAEPERSRDVFRLNSWFILRIALLIALVLLVAPRELLVVAFGAAWAPAAGILRLLSAYAIAIPVFEHVRVLLVAHGRVDAVLRARIVQLGFFLPAVVVLVAVDGARGAAVAVAIAMVLGVVAISYQARAIARYPIRGFAVPLLATAAATGVGAAVNASVSSADIVDLGASVAAAWICYVGLVLLFEASETRQNLTRLVRSVQGRDDVAAST